jgi:carbonic anhydrase
MIASPVPTPAKALERLLAGNTRYQEGRAVHPDQDLARRGAVIRQQAPIATILGCADSRVPPQLVFDQGLGDLFTIRVAGNVVDEAVLSSIEYSVTALGVPLIVVLGHTHCGAIAAVADQLEQSTPPPKYLRDLMRQLAPAVTQARALGGELLSTAACFNVQRVIARLAAEPTIAAPLNRGRLGLVGALYELESGRVTLSHAVGSWVPGVPLANEDGCPAILVGT